MIPLTGELAEANPHPTFVPTAQLLPLLYPLPQLTSGGLLTPSGHSPNVTSSEPPNAHHPG